MKKTLVALAVAAVAATSANAATVYEADGTKVELSGSLRLILGKFGDDQRGDLRNDGSRLYVKASHDLGNGLTGFAALQLRFDEVKKNAAGQDKTTGKFGNPRTKDLYAGFKHADVGTLSFGRQATNADDILQDNAYFHSGALNPLTTSGDKVVKFRSREWNGFSFGLDYLFSDNANKNKIEAGDYKQGYAGSLFYNYDLGEHAFELAGVYAQDKFDRGAGNRPTESDRTYYTWAVHFGYNYGPFDLGLNYGQYKNDYRYNVGGTSFNPSKLADTAEKGTYILVDASYQVIEPSRVYVQWERLDGEAFNSDRKAFTNRIIGGVDYKLHKNVVTYVEYGYQRTKKPTGNNSTDHSYGVGLRLHF